MPQNVRHLVRPMSCIKQSVLWQVQRVGGARLLIKADKVRAVHRSAGLCRSSGSSGVMCEPCSYGRRAPQIRRAGALAVAKAVGAAKGLRLLALDENEISESGVEHLKACHACSCASCPPLRTPPPGKLCSANVVLWCVPVSSCMDTCLAVFRPDASTVP